MCFTRAYLRASTDEQDVNRAKQDLINFANEHNLNICNFYSENISGATLKRPELLRLLDDSQENDILLVEDIDRLSRLNNSDWQKLKDIIRDKKIRIVAVNAPTTWSQTQIQNGNEFDNRILSAINELLIDMLASFARRDYEQRRERQAQGIKKAKQQGKFKGRKTDVKLYKSIVKLTKAGHTYKEIIELLGCSSRTISKAKKWHEAQEQEKLNEDLALKFPVYHDILNE